MSSMWFWVIVFIVLLICELASPALISIWFCGGAVAALISNIAGLGFSFQFLIFLFASLVLLVLTRPFAKKIFKKDPLKTNVSALIGKKAVVTKEIDNDRASGEIIVNGQLWSAKAMEDVKIKPSSKVVIEEIQGVKAIVKSI